MPNSCSKNFLANRRIPLSSNWIFVEVRISASVLLFTFPRTEQCCLRPHLTCRWVIGPGSVWSYFSFGYQQGRCVRGVYARNGRLVVKTTNLLFSFLNKAWCVWRRPLYISSSRYFTGALLITKPSVFPHCSLFFLGRTLFYECLLKHVYEVLSSTSATRLWRQWLPPTCVICASVKYLSVWFVDAL